MKKKGQNKPKTKGIHFLQFQDLTIGQKASDLLTSFVGSWTFITLFLVMMVVWIYLNVRAILGEWDPYPFILLNFVLSCLAAIQAPIILMSQNREMERDRLSQKYDYQVNRKAEREIQKILRELTAIKKKVYGDLNEIKTKPKKRKRKKKFLLQ